MDLNTETMPVLPVDKRSKNSTIDLMQYINPAAQGRARQALQAHHGAAYLDSYKTVMCQTWLETASCGFGSNCKFAHGEAELRQTNFPPPCINTRKYKTRLCDKYTKKGICPYGRRCLFIHPEMPVELFDNCLREPENLSGQITQPVSNVAAEQKETGSLFVPNVNAPAWLPKERRSSLPCDPPEIPSNQLDIPWASSSDLYLPPPALQQRNTSFFIPPPPPQTVMWPKGRDRRSSVPCDPLQVSLSITEVPWNSTNDLYSMSPDNNLKSQQSIWSSHEDVFSAFQESTPSSGNSVGSTCQNIISIGNPLSKQKTEILDDSYGCFKDYKDTLASSLATVLDLSDVKL